MRGSQKDPKIVGLLFGHPQKDPPICRNSHADVGDCYKAFYKSVPPALILFLTDKKNLGPEIHNTEHAY